MKDLSRARREKKKPTASGLPRPSRRRSSSDRIEFDEEIHSPEEGTSGPEADLAGAIAAESVRKGLSQLAVEFREVLVLRELEGMSYKEIAQVAGVPIGTVMSRLARGRKQLSAALAAGTEGSA